LRIGRELKGNKRAIKHVKDMWSKFRVHKDSKTISSQEMFSQETKKLRAQFDFIDSPILRPMIKNYYLTKALLRYYQERGIVPLSSGPGKI
jgi:hypothetical protein